MSINMSVTDAKCAPLALLIVGLMLLGCESLRVYDGPKRADSELAHIAGDSRVAGVPLAVILRQVDGADLGVRYSSVKVLPGAHSLLIDCTVTESKQTSRHHLDVDVDADVHYRLVANTGPSNRDCVAVQLVQIR